jgi:hypothetical protein
MLARLGFESFFILYSTILYYIQNYEYQKNLFFEIMFG